MDQTDVAVTAGFIAAPISAVLLWRLTGWSGWIAMPVGAIGGFLAVAVIVYVGIGLLGRHADSGKDADREDRT
jgi:hypothetical protein